MMYENIWLLKYSVANFRMSVMEDDMKNKKGKGTKRSMPLMRLNQLVIVR